MEIMAKEEVARILRCSPDTLSRVPKSELPVYRGPGRCNLYLLEDIKRYLKSRRINAGMTDDLMKEVLGS